MEKFDINKHPWANSFTTSNGVVLKECIKHSKFNPTETTIEKRYNTDEILGGLVDCAVITKEGVCYDTCYLKVSNDLPIPIVQSSPSVQNKVTKNNVIKSEKAKEAYNNATKKIQDIEDSKTKLALIRSDITTQRSKLNSLGKENMSNVYKAVLDEKETSLLRAKQQAKDRGVSEEDLYNQPEVNKLTKELNVYYLKIKDWDKNNGKVAAENKLNDLLEQNSTLIKQIYTNRQNLSKNLIPYFYVFIIKIIAIAIRASPIKY